MRPPVIFALLIAATLAAAPEAPPFVVIVNAANAAALTREEIANIFMKRMTQWHDGGPIVVVDALPGSRVREEFSRAVLHRGTTAMEAYWRQQIFSGRGVPPVQKETDAGVVAFVRRTRGGIGYVAAGTPLDGVRAVSWR